MHKIEKLLREERYFEAWFLSQINDSARETFGALLCKANFNPFEPRDDRGWWTRNGGAAGSGEVVTEIAYRGYFHDVVVDDLLKGLAETGSKVVKNVRVLGINGILAIPDGGSKPSGANTPYFIEVKTGKDPPFTPNQRQVYPLICIGGHATSFDPRISDLGLTMGSPFPPLKIWLVYTRGPGLPLRMIDYCDEFVFGGRTRVP